MGSTTIKLPGIFHYLKKKKRRHYQPWILCETIFDVKSRNSGKILLTKMIDEIGTLGYSQSHKCFLLYRQEERKEKALGIFRHNKRLWTCPCRGRKQYATDAYGLLRVICLQWHWPGLSAGRSRLCQPNPAKYVSTCLIFSEWFQWDNSQHIKVPPKVLEGRSPPIQSLRLHLLTCSVPSPCCSPPIRGFAARDLCRCQGQHQTSLGIPLPVALQRMPAAARLHQGFLLPMLLLLLELKCWHASYEEKNVFVHWSMRELGEGDGKRFWKENKKKMTAKKGLVLPCF